MASLDWMSEAVCAQVGTELFFPEQGGNPAQAVAICRRCPVRQECLDHALELDRSIAGQVTGIWGGTTAKQRQAIKGAAYRQLAS
jgi:WhiB family redox-sensing transcriptional regulator